MRIREVHIDGFGTWKDLFLGDLGDGVTVIYGPNEAGKTTLMQFVRSMMFGFNPARRQRYLPPLRGGRPGGSLGIVDQDASYRVIRHARLDDPLNLAGDITVVAPDGANFGQTQLDVVLGGVDEATFSNVFAFGLKEIQELGSLDDTAAADHLYRLTGGLDRVSLVDVVRELQASQQRIVGTHDKPAALAQLVGRRDRLRDELREAGARSARWLKLATLRADLQHEAEQLEGHISAADDRVRLMEVALQNRDLWKKHRTLAERLEKLGKPKQIAKKYVALLAKYNERSNRSEARLKEIKVARGKLLEQAKDIRINRSIWSQAARIEALVEHSGWVESLENQLERLRNELRGHETSLTTQTREAGSPGFDVSVANQQTVASLRKPARQISEEEERVEQAKRLTEEIRAEHETLVQKIEQRLHERNETDLQTALANAAEKIQLLRRRIQLEQRLDQVGRHREEYENYRDDLFERHVKPMWMTVGIGVAFSTGIGLILVSLITQLSSIKLTDDPRVLLVLGATLVLLSFAFKYGVDRQSSLKLDSVRRQLLALNRQLDEIRAQRDQLDESLPRLSGSLDVRLGRAEEDLRRLEELVPLQGQRDGLKTRLDQAVRAEQDAENGLKEARSRWKTALRSLGLPENFSLTSVRQYSAKGEELTNTRRQLDAIRDELQQRERELLSLATRIDQLMGDIRLKPVSERPVERLQQLARALEEQRDLDFQKGDLRRQVREYRKEYDQARRLVRRDGRSRENLFHKLGVRNEKEFHRSVERWQQFRVLTRRVSTAHLKLLSALAERITEEQLAHELAGEHPQPLEQRREDLLVKMREHRVRLGQIHEKRGQYQQEMATLADDRRLDELRVDLSSVDRQIARQVREWQACAVTENVLTSVRKIYETHRQPETLREASEYLKQLTGGHYTRIWTPLEDRTLRVDDGEGKPVRLDVLSRGTREAIFLALRLALVNSFARRGAKLPLVLDDILVNFDASRVRSAAAALRDFAKEHGQQIIFFTCHEHITKIFRGLKVDIRTLPGHVINEEPEVEKPKKKKPEPEVIVAPEPPPPAPVIVEPVLVVEPPPPPPPPPVIIAPPPVVVIPPVVPLPRPREQVESIPDFHEFALHAGRDQRTYHDLWAIHSNDLYGVDEVVIDKPRPRFTVAPLPAPRRTFIEELPPPTRIAVRELPRRKIRQRFAWESPERYEDDFDDRISTID